MPERVSEHGLDTGWSPDVDGIPHGVAEGQRTGLTLGMRREWAGRKPRELHCHVGRLL